MRTFTSSISSEVAGIFCTCTGIVPGDENRGSEIIFAHNPFAKTKIEARTFKFGTEYYADTEWLYLPPYVHPKR